ncbi:putative membrane protein (DUF2127) [Mariprofundus ferrinatatus]|uniref:Putative membrane protein (DUF2127) n=1 Tax=Mariprofundus ferrinatatus TaxID=1921087 RepID=A0A2K8L659_9PROT|nr:DUF2127 domain-containing protein [Mariprofundus ferrinatatus]ATX81739.1 putative membrane protein (DUF2127) [Mariprofundus ferrinatatus]
MFDLGIDGKPRCLVILAVYTGFGGLLCLVYGVPSIIFDLFALDLALINLIVVAIGVSTLLGSYGLWRLKRWGYYLAIAIYVVSIQLSVVAISLDDSPANITLQLVGIGIAVFFLFYLFGKETRKLFH